MASWPQLGVPLGLLLCTALVQIMSAATGPEFLAWGWRVPFLVSIVLVGVGLYVRLRVLESPEFTEVRKTQTALPQNSLPVDTLIAAAIGLISVPLFGHLSDRIGRRTMYAIGIGCVAVFAFPYFGLLNTAVPGLVLLAIVLSLVFHDMQYGPQAALIAESVGANIRYRGTGIGYQLASVIAILAGTGSSTWISVYILGCCVVSLVALVLLPRRTLEA